MVERNCRAKSLGAVSGMFRLSTVFRLSSKFGHR